MIITQCAVATRHCDAACQHEHWANGHKKKCKKIARGGGAEPYHADKKAKEAADAAWSLAPPGYSTSPVESQQRLILASRARDDESRRHTRSA